MKPKTVLVLAANKRDFKEAKREYLPICSRVKYVGHLNDLLGHSADSVELFFTTDCEKHGLWSNPRFIEELKVLVGNGVRFHQANHNTLDSFFDKSLGSPWLAEPHTKPPRFAKFMRRPKLL